MIHTTLFENVRIFCSLVLSTVVPYMLGRSGTTLSGIVRAGLVFVWLHERFLALILIVAQSHFGEELLTICVVFPRNGTAVLS